MSVKSLFYFILCSSYSAARITDTFKNQKRLSKCVVHILTEYYISGSEITLININFDDIEIVKEINLMQHVSIVSKTMALNRKHLAHVTNDGYIIMAKDCIKLLENLTHLTKDIQWDPSKRIVVLLEINTSEKDLNLIFNKFMQLHASNVNVIDTIDYSIYTYDPYENNGCGRKYERIIKLRKCILPHRHNFFRNKVRIHNCTFNVITAHYPPYTVDYSRSSIKLPGAEQCALDLLAKMQHFHLNYTFADFSEEFSTVDDDNVAFGSLSYLQNNTYDILAGSNILIAERTRAFDYVYGHMAYVDDIRVFVPVAGKMPKWKKVYTEFNPIVWMILAITFIVYSIIVLLIFRKTKSHSRFSIVLKLWDNIFMHAGSQLKCSFTVKCVLILWLWFTFLINSYYQTNLMSLTTANVYEYQVKTIEDLKLYNFKSCLGTVVSDYLNNFDIHVNASKFKSLEAAFKFVSKHDYCYTIAPLLAYKSKEHLFLDSDGYSSLLYMYSKPLNMLITGIYLYKGFPGAQTMNELTLHLREEGHIDKCLQDYFGALMINRVNVSETAENVPLPYIVKLRDFRVPYGILSGGLLLSLIVFAFELFFGKYLCTIF